MLCSIDVLTSVSKDSANGRPQGRVSLGWKAVHHWQRGLFGALALAVAATTPALVAAQAASGQPKVAFVQVDKGKRLQYLAAATIWSDPGDLTPAALLAGPPLKDGSGVEAALKGTPFPCTFAQPGKTMGGAVWLNADMRSPYDYWQFWRNTEDADVGRFMRLFTDMPLDEIARLEALPGAEINEAKKVLANAATTLLHGPEEAAKAAAAAQAAFEQGTLSDDLPTHEIARSDLDAGIVLATLAADAGLAASRGEARRLAQGGGLRVNDKPETDGNRTLTSADLVDGVVKLAAGKKKIVLVKPI